MPFTIVIPARYASSRFPGKPLAAIAGKPMVVQVAERAARCGARVIVATDDTRIRDAVEAHGHTALMTRADHATGTDRLAEVAAKLRLPATHIVVNVQGDEPLIPPALISRVADNLAAHRAASIATACTPISDAADLANPSVVKVVMDKAGYALYFSRAAIPHARDAFAAGIPKVLPRGLPVFRHLGLYAYRAGFLKAFKKMRPVLLEQFEALEQLRALAYGHRISVAITRAAPHPGVDTPADLQRVLAHMRPRRR